MEVQTLLNNSILLKHWPSILLGWLIVLAVKYFKTRQTKRRSLDDGQQNVAVDFDETNNNIISDLKPALEEKPHVPFKAGLDLNPNGAWRFFELMNGRRSVRHFNAKVKPSIDTIQDCIRAAGTAPSGAHTEPWTFCVIEKQSLKQAIREIVEHEEEINYGSRMHAQWITDLRPLQTKPVKQYLTDAPYLVLVFKQTYGVTLDGRKKLHYYNEISTSIATGILLCALNAAGLCSLVTTPLNCGAGLRRLLERPENEKLLILLAVGYAADSCLVPDLKRKNIEDIMVKY